MKIKTIFIGRRPARETPRDQGGGRAKRVRCQALIEAGAKEMNRALKFGGLGGDRFADDLHAFLGFGIEHLVRIERSQPFCSGLITPDTSIGG